MIQVGALSVSGLVFRKVEVDNCVLVLLGFMRLRLGFFVIILVTLYDLHSNKQNHFKFDRFKEAQIKKIRFNIFILKMQI